MVKTTLVDIQQVQCQICDRLGDLPLATHFGIIAHPAQQAVGNARRAPGTSGDLEGALVLDRQAQNATRTADDGRQVFGVVELQALDDTKAITQRIGQHARPGRGTDQGERW
ncbi:hypothetical protein D3C86_1885380 [compost metagenome]